MLSLLSGPLTARLTVKVPFPYVCCGLASVLVPLSPNVQLQLVILPVDVSENCTDNGEKPAVGFPAKLASQGCAGPTVM
jgi:hypothetical protein